MRILVTGVNSTVGRTAVARLSAAGHDVSGVLGNDQQPLDVPALAAAADVSDAVIQLAPIEPGAPGSIGIDGLIQVCEAATRAGARLLHLSHAAGHPTLRGQAEELVESCWAPSLIIRAAPLVGRQLDWSILRSVTTFAALRGPGVVRVLHTDDLYRFLVRSVGSHRTGAVDLAGAQPLTTASLRRWLGPVDRHRKFGTWARPDVVMDTAALQQDWDFECGWRSCEALVDTGRALQGAPVAIEYAGALDAAALTNAHRAAEDFLAAPGQLARSARAVVVARRYPNWCADYAIPQRVLVAAPETLSEAQLDVRIALLTDHIQRGWVLSTIGVRLTELLPGRHHRLDPPALCDLSESGPPLSPPESGQAVERAAQPAGAHRAVEQIYRGFHEVSAETARAVGKLRKALREKGSRMASRRVLATGEDIFHLRLDEVLAPPVDTRLRVTRRKLPDPEPDDELGLAELITELEPQGQA